MPFATLVVELEEGPRVLAATEDCARARSRIGTPVRCSVERRSEDFALVWAEPARDTTTTTDTPEG